MRNLNELQKDFQRYLTQQDVAIENEIVNNTPVSAVTRLEIYREAYYLRLLEALQHDFPVLAVMLGTTAFAELGRRYIDAQPSRFRSLRWFGQSLADFLQTVSDYADKTFLREMAQFEWTLTEAFDAPDSVVVTLAEIATVPADKWPSLCFKLHPAVRRLDVQWNVAAIWSAVKGEKPSPALAPAPLIWLFWRQALDVQFCSLSPSEAYMIDAMAAGATFADICEGLCEWVAAEEVALHAASLLKRFIVDELVSGLLL